MVQILHSTCPQLLNSDYSTCFPAGISGIRLLHLKFAPSLPSPVEDRSFLFTPREICSKHLILKFSAISPNNSRIFGLTPKEIHGILSPPLKSSTVS